LSLLTHEIDDFLFPHNAFAIRAHGLLWFAALIVVVTLLYRKLMGVTTLAGVASVLFAFDHAHGFAAGYVANRNAIIALLFGALAIYFHVDWRANGSRKGALLSAVFLTCALLSGESAVATIGYLFAYAAFLEAGNLRQRIKSLVPSVAVFTSWAVSYSSLGYGARGSGLYVDPLREPLQFVFATMERVPLLTMGQFLLPPAEAYNYAPKPLAIAIWLGALLLLLSLIVVALPLVRRNALARFWSLGLFISLISVCSSHPNNRLLFFAGLGAMGLLSQLWHGLVNGADWLLGSGLWRRFANGLVATVTAFHIFISPLLLPFAACSILLSSGVNRAIAKLAEEEDLADRDLVIVNSPDYFFVKLIPMVFTVEKYPKPRRLRALSIGPIPIDVTRMDSKSLLVVYHGGILQTSLMELYRNADIPMQPGQRIELRGLRIEITDVTRDNRASGARFTFDKNIDDPRFRWMKWDGSHYVPFQLPAVGETVHLPAAEVPYGI
jgi:hypothetical protein